MSKKPQTAKAFTAVPMTSTQVDALQRVLRGEDPNATVVIPSGCELLLPTNGLAGAFTNEDGEAV